MNAWHKFLLFNAKSVTFRKSFIVPLVILVVGTVGIFIATDHASNKLSMASIVASDITNNQTQKQKFIKRQEKVPAALRKRLNAELEIVKSYNHGNWSKAAKNKIIINNEDIKTSRLSGDQDSARAMQLENITLTYSAKYNVFPNTQDLGVQGFNFLGDFLNIYFPEIILLFLIFMFSPLFIEKYQGQRNMDKLIPRSLAFLDGNRLTTAIIGAAFTYLMIVILAFGIATLTHGIGEFDYPVVLEADKIVGTVSIGVLLIKVIVLQLLSIVVTMALIQLLANVTRNQNLTLLIAAGLSLLQAVAPSNFSFMNGILQFLPGTYFNSYQIVNQQLSYTTDNAQLTFGFGISVLLFYIIILILFNLGYERIIRSRNIV
ncbi:hypothetical protein [Lactiplantibacillus pentosus]|uniref:hypothetical protein n=1 Tax=Lactiplantibacillus pentosus TaxID=1589 RepID=UPI0021820DA7|nr:hypothetical protein [Lactiplantibacillus pentosus]MCT0163562.1 hypothetical protein [Lactiplantibacillus pentosus]